MSNNKHSGRLGWLYAALGKQYGRIESLLCRLTGIAPDPNKPWLFRKFACLLQQVAAEKIEQERYLREIKSIEQRHEMMRWCKKLKLAGPKPSGSNPELD